MGRGIFSHPPPPNRGTQTKEGRSAEEDDADQEIRRGHSRIRAIAMLSDPFSIFVNIFTPLYLNFPFLFIFSHLHNVFFNSTICLFFSIFLPFTSASEFLSLCSHFLRSHFSIRPFIHLIFPFVLAFLSPPIFVPFGVAFLHLNLCPPPQGENCFGT